MHLETLVPSKILCIYIMNSCCELINIKWTRKLHDVVILNNGIGIEGQT